MPETPLTTSEKVSSLSTAVSPSTATSTCRLVWPAGMTFGVAAIAT
jgi:hypothetical protein